MRASPVPDLLERVYAAFAAEPPPREIEVCPCCQDPAAFAPLLTTSLRQLTADQLSRYASSAMLTVGSDADFRFFLPRILEISVRESNWWPDREVVLQKLELANWSRWPEAETAPLLRLFEAAFAETLLLQGSTEREVDSWICALSIARIDIEPYLRKLEAPAASGVLRAFFEMNAAALRTGELANHFWASANPAPVIAWFRSAEVQAVVWRPYVA